MRAVLAGWAKCIYPHYIYEVQLNNYEKQSSLYLFIRSSSHHITCTFPLPNSTTPSGRFESLLSLLHPLVKLVSIGEKSSRLNWQSTAIWLFFWLFFFFFFFLWGLFRVAWDADHGLSERPELSDRTNIVIVTRHEKDGIHYLTSQSLLRTAFRADFLDWWKSDAPLPEHKTTASFSFKPRFSS